MSYKVIGVILEPVAENPIPGCIFALVLIIGVPIVCCNIVGAKLGLWEDIPREPNPPAIGRENLYEGQFQFTGFCYNSK